MQHADYIKRAIALAKRAEGFTHPNPMVGCVIVKDGSVIAEGWHKAPGEEHAEAMALRLAGEAARGSTVYVTLEPCNHYGRTPPCSQALIKAGVHAVYFGAIDTNPIAERGAHALKEAGIHAEYLGGEIAEACDDLIRPWREGLRRDRPWIAAKIASSLDGFTALPSGESKWITGEAARSRGHDLRQRTGAIIVGVHTILADDPSLDARPDGRTAAPSLKAIFDSQLRTPPTARVLQSPGDVLLICHPSAPSQRESALVDAGADVLRVEGEDRRPDLLQSLRQLKEREVIDAMIEGGSTMLGAAFDAECVDEVWAFIAPKLLGDGQRAMAMAPPVRLAQAFSLQDPVTETLGSDVLIRGRVAPRVGRE